MMSSIFIIIFSAVLFLYWFRYTCVLILRSKTPQDYSEQVVAANQLSYPAVEEQLRGVGSNAEFDTLVASLQRDYRLLSYLLSHAAGMEMGGYTLEQRMLMIDFKVMQVWYAVTRRCAVRQSREALQEMAQVLHNLANAMGERAACPIE
jgi:hypothetical protein